MLLELLKGGNIHADGALLVLDGVLAGVGLPALAGHGAERLDRPPFVIGVQQFLVAVWSAKAAKEVIAASVRELDFLRERGAVGADLILNLEDLPKMMWRVGNLLGIPQSVTRKSFLVWKPLLLQML